MLVIAMSVGADLRWRGRRHDDDGPGAVQGVDVDSLFDAVFGALHDGEQVGLGCTGVLTAPDGPAPDPAGPALSALADLLARLGDFRPWTVVSTSLPRWRATTSVLVWQVGTPGLEAGNQVLDAAVEQLFRLVTDGADAGAEDRGVRVANLPAALAQQAGLSVDATQLHEPVVLVRVASDRTEG